MEKIKPISELANIFRAMNGDKESQKIVEAHTATMYKHAETFEEFLKINNLPIFEQILSINKLKRKNIKWEEIGRKLNVDKSLVFLVSQRPYKYTVDNFVRVAKVIGIDEKSARKIWKNAKITNAVEKITRKAGL